MKQYTLDKISSVTKNLSLIPEVAVTETITAVEGAVLVVEVLEDKKIYNQLELVSGRMSKLQKGDIIAVALGNRRALKGFVGEVPKSLAVGDIINVLNMGGVAGICTSENVSEVGHALRVKVLGQIERDGQALNIKVGRLFAEQERLTASAPLIVISGTCMNVGKTSAASEIIKYGNRHGFKIFAAKVAGVSAMKDTENMKDHGAKNTVSFTDAGYSSTADSTRTVAITKGAISYLSALKPDYIVVEFGDGLLGEYGVMDILKDAEIQQNIVAHVGCAHDPVGALKLGELCAQIGTPLNVVSGPVTDNSVGVSFVERALGLKAYNALTDGEKLFNYILATCLKK